MASLLDLAVYNSQPQAMNRLANTLGSIRDENRMRDILSAIITDPEGPTPEKLKALDEKYHLSPKEWQVVIQKNREFQQFKLNKLKLQEAENPMITIDSVDPDTGRTYKKRVPRTALEGQGVLTGLPKATEYKPQTKQDVIDIAKAKQNKKYSRWWDPKNRTWVSLPAGRAASYENLIPEEQRLQQLRSEAKNNNPKEQLNRNRTILDTAIKVLKQRPLTANVFADINVEDLMNPDNAKTYLQTFQEAAKSKDLVTRQAALKGLKAMKEILGISEEQMTVKPKIVNPKANITPPGVYNYDPNSGNLIKAE